VKSGEATAHPEFHHSVHVVPDGLEPRTTYYYRFKVGEEWTSPVARTRTAPSATADLASARFVVAACQAYHQGYYTAYKHIAAEEDIDAVLHLGDYMYEYAVNSKGGDRNDPSLQLPERFNKETVTLEDYRLRYSLFHLDKDLQAAHHAHPFILTWDDHEIENNYAGDTAQDGTSGQEFLTRKAAAYRAFYENLPLRPPQQPEGPRATLYRRFHWGTLAQFDVLDGRQNRDDQVPGDGWLVPTKATSDPKRTMLGAEQEAWFAAGLQSSTALWNVIPQQTIFARRHMALKPPYQLSMDAWDGYPAARQRFMDAVNAAGIENLVVLTGDVHVQYAIDLKEDYDNPDSKTTGVEVVTTSLSSNGNGKPHPDDWEVFMKANPHLKFYNGQRGYVLLTLDRKQLRADYRTVANVTTPGGALTTTASYVSKAGSPGLKPA
jgi:alkaline phosphatase D